MALAKGTNADEAQAPSNDFDSAWDNHVAQSDNKNADNFDSAWGQASAKLAKNNLPDLKAKVDSGDKSAIEPYQKALTEYYSGTSWSDRLNELIPDANTAEKIANALEDTIGSVGSSVWGTVKGLIPHPVDTVTGLTRGVVSGGAKALLMVPEALSGLKQQIQAGIGDAEGAASTATERAAQMAEINSALESFKNAEPTGLSVTGLPLKPSSDYKASEALKSGAGVGEIAGMFATPIPKIVAPAVAPIQEEEIARRVLTGTTGMNRIAGLAEPAGDIIGGKISGWLGSHVGRWGGKKIGEAMKSEPLKGTSFRSLGHLERESALQTRAIELHSQDLDAAKLAGDGKAELAAQGKLNDALTKMEGINEARSKVDGAILGAEAKADRWKIPNAAIKGGVIGGAYEGLVGTPGESVAPGVAGGAAFGVGGHFLSKPVSDFVNYSLTKKPIGAVVPPAPPARPAVPGATVVEEPVAPVATADAIAVARRAAPPPAPVVLVEHPNTANPNAPVLLKTLGIPGHDNPSLATTTEGGLKSMSIATEEAGKAAIMGRNSPYSNMVELPNGKEIKSIGYGDGFIIIKVKKPTLDNFQTYLYEGTLEQAQAIVNSSNPYKTFLDGIKKNNPTSRVVDFHDRILTKAANDLPPPAPAPAPTGPLAGAPPPQVPAENGPVLSTLAEQPAAPAATPEPVKSESQQYLENQSQIITPTSAELANAPRIMQESLTKSLGAEREKFLKELKDINDRLEAESGAKAEAKKSAEEAKRVADEKAAQDEAKKNENALSIIAQLDESKKSTEQSKLSAQESSIQGKMDQVMENHGISRQALARIRERYSPEEFAKYLDDRIASKPTDLSVAKDWLANIEERLAANRADLSAKEQAHVERAQDLLSAFADDERARSSPADAEALRAKLAEDQAVSDVLGNKEAADQKTAGEAISEAESKAATAKRADDVITALEADERARRSPADAEALRVKLAAEAAKPPSATPPPEEPPAAPAVKKPTPPTPAPAAGKFAAPKKAPAKALAAQEAPPAPEPAPKPVEPAKPAKKAVVEEPVEESSPHDKAWEKVDEALLDPEVKKSTIMAIANKSKANGLISEKDLAELQRISKDRDMGPEDIGPELKGMLEANGYRAKQAPVKVSAAEKEPVIVKTDNGKTAAPTVKLDNQVSQLATKKQLDAQKQYLGNALSTLGESAPEIPAFPKAETAKEYADHLDTIKRYENIGGVDAARRVTNAKKQIGELSKFAPKVTVEVPGDGQFKIINDKSHIEAFAEIVEKSFGKGIKPIKPSARSVPKLTPEELASHTMTPEEAANFGVESKPAEGSKKNEIKVAEEPSHPIDRIESSNASKKAFDRQNSTVNLEKNPEALSLGGSTYPTLVSKDGKVKIALDATDIYVARYGVSYADRSDVSPNRLTIAGIVTEAGSRGQGLASKAMDALIASADEKGITLKLEPQRMTEFAKKGDKTALTTKQLAEWYKKKGFVQEAKGSDMILVREPILEENAGYSSGDLGYGRDTTAGRMSGGRGTGHAGTGVYYTSKGKSSTGRSDRPVHRFDASKYKLYKPSDNESAANTFSSLKYINGMVDNPSLPASNASFIIWLEMGMQSKFSQADVEGIIAKSAKETREDLLKYEARHTSQYIDSASTRVVKALGYEGIDVRGLSQFDNTDHGSVIYAKSIKP